MKYLLQLPIIYHIRLAKPSNNLLHKSIIYNSEASIHIIYNKARFINKLESIYKWLWTPAGDLFIEGWATMLVTSILYRQKREFKFKTTTYILSTDITLVSV